MEVMNGITLLISETVAVYASYKHTFEDAYMHMHLTDLYWSGTSTLFIKNELFLFADLLTQLNLDTEMTNTMKNFCSKIYWHIHMTFSWYHDKLSVLTSFISSHCTEVTKEMN
jgi:hypothetical protein